MPRGTLLMSSRMLGSAIALTMLAGCAHSTNNTDTEKMAEPDSGDTAVGVDWYEAADHQPSRLVSSYRHVIGPADEHGELSIASVSKGAGISPQASAPPGSPTSPGSGVMPTDKATDGEVEKTVAGDSTDQEQEIAQNGDARSARGSADGTSRDDDASNLPWARYCAADSRKSASLTDEEFEAIREWQNRTGQVAPQQHQPCTVLK